MVSAWRRVKPSSRRVETGRRRAEAAIHRRPIPGWAIAAWRMKRRCRRPVAPVRARHRPVRMPVIAIAVPRAVRAPAVIDVHIDEHVAAAPVRPRPAPQAAERANADRHAHAERQSAYQRRAGVIAWRRRQVVRRIGRVGPGAVNGHRVVARHIHNVRLRRLNNDGAAFSAHHLVLAGLQLAGDLRLLPQALHGGHDVRLLNAHGVAELLQPVRLLRHHGQYLRERNQGFYRGIPRQRRQGSGQLVAAQLRIGGIAHPARGSLHLVRVGGSHQHLGKQLVGIQRDRRQNGVELLGCIALLLLALLWRRRGLGE